MTTYIRTTLILNALQVLVMMEKKSLQEMDDFYTTNFIAAGAKSHSKEKAPLAEHLFRT